MKVVETQLTTALAPSIYKIIYQVTYRNSIYIKSDHIMHVFLLLLVFFVINKIV